MAIDKQGNHSVRPENRLWHSSLIFIVIFIWALPAMAVDEGKTSYTADAVCAFRSIGALDPDPKTRNPDHMANLFVNPMLKQSFPGLGLAYDDAKTAMDNMKTGVLYWINARTHHFDAKLVHALKAGVRQVVILGAGFDSRAYRFHDAYPDVRFFEIDLPDTSADKQKRVQAILGKIPRWVTYVPIDFNTQTLDEVLGKAGFAEDQKTFFVWEGVTYYISRIGVDNTLRYIAERSAPGSQVVFDYMLEDVVQGMDYTPYGARDTVMMIANYGEPYIFGIAPQHLETFVNQRGLSLISDLGPSELTRRYLIQSDGTISGKIAGFLHIVHARVPARGQRQELIRKAEKQIEGSVTAKAPGSKPSRVTVPNEVQALLDNHSRCMTRKDYGTMVTHFSKKYLFNGATREDAMVFIQGLYANRPIKQFEFILTRFEHRGNKARINGYVQRKGFRTPIPLAAMDIVKEDDGCWRWYGNQQ